MTYAQQQHGAAVSRRSVSKSAEIPDTQRLPGSCLDIHLLARKLTEHTDEHKPEQLQLEQLLSCVAALTAHAHSQQQPPDDHRH